MTLHLTKMAEKIPRKQLSDMMQKQIDGMKKQPGFGLLCEKAEAEVLD